MDPSFCEQRIEILNLVSLHREDALDRPGCRGDQHLPYAVIDITGEYPVNGGRYVPDPPGAAVVQGERQRQVCRVQRQRPQRGPDRVGAAAACAQAAA